jgi:hypothetical protein
MSDDDETSHSDMDEAFCARMRAPVGVITTPGTRNPKYVAAKQVVRLRQGSDFWF